MLALLLGILALGGFGLAGLMLWLLAGLVGVFRSDR